MINRFRALFPRWDFFDRVAYQFSLEFKLSPGGNWQALDFSQTRTLRNLFYNPATNLALAQMSLIDQYVLHIENKKEQDITLKMLAALVRVKVQPKHEFQFKIMAIKDNDRTELFVSSWLEAGQE